MNAFRFLVNKPVREESMAYAAESGFRDAMRTLTSAVSIITVGDIHRRVGMVATAVSSLSMAPPSLLVCVNMEASIHTPLLEIGTFCINILHGSQEEIAKAFARKKGEERFSSGVWKQDDGLPPRLEGAQSSIICDVVSTHVHGTHRIFIGNARDSVVRKDIEPLLYQDGHYAALETEFFKQEVRRAG